MFKALITDPLYNGFILVLDIIPHNDAGLAIILFTLIVSVVIYPLSRKALATQARMKQYEGELRDLKERYASNKEEQARAMLAFYREKGINPFASIILMFIQLPIIIGVYFVFARAGLPEIDMTRLYSFIAPPEAVNMVFLSIIDISQKSLILALLAAVAQFIQGWYSPALAAPPKKEVSTKKVNGKPSFEESFSAGMRVQTRYFRILHFVLLYVCAL